MQHRGFWENEVVDIISKPSGPRDEDKRIRRLLDENRSTITRLADHLSGGAYSARKATLPEPQADPAIIRHIGAATQTSAPAPHLRISPNGRVVVMDQNSGRQLHYLGEVRRAGGVESFRLATAANGFIAPLDQALAASLQALDGQVISPDCSEDDLLTAIAAKLDLA